MLFTAFVSEEKENIHRVCHCRPCEKKRQAIKIAKSRTKMLVTVQCVHINTLYAVRTFLSYNDQFISVIIKGFTN